MTQSGLGKGQHKFPIIEIFGPTVQGEGLLIGRPTHFIRFGGCDYRCTWCDSLHAVIPAEVRRNSVKMNTEEIIHELKNRNQAQYVTLSGGNPALQPMAPLLKRLKEEGYKTVIETQGTILPNWIHDVDIVVVSPKPPSSGMVTDWDKLRNYARLPHSHLKVVVFNEPDYEYARNVRSMFPDKMMFVSVGNNVGLDSTDELLDRLRWLTEKVLADPVMQDVIPLPQLHVLIWGNAKGV